jgi:hypothetical protein
MLYIVDIDVSGDRLSERMNQMRMWLDHMRCQTASFRQVAASDDPVYRVDFFDENQARAFAQAFGGKILSRTASL